MRILGSGTVAGVAAGVAAQRYAAGLVSVYDASALTGLTNGQGMSSWPDTLANYNATSAEGGSSQYPTYSTNGGPGGGPCVNFSQASKQHFRLDLLSQQVFSDFGQQGVGNVFTFACLMKRSSASVQSIAFGLYSTASLAYSMHATDASGGTFSDGTAFMVVSAGSHTLPTTGSGYSLATFSNEWAVVVYVHNGASSAAYVNGQKFAGTVAGDGSTTYDIACLGGMFFNGSLHPSTFDGSMAKAWVWNRALTDGDVAGFVLAQSLSSYLRFTVQVEGDSISADYSSPDWVDMLSTASTWPSTAVLQSPTTNVISSRNYIAKNSAAARTAAPNPTSAGNDEVAHVAANCANYNANLGALIIAVLHTNDLYESGVTAPFVNLVAQTTAARYFRTLGLLRQLCPDALIVAYTMLKRGNYNAAGAGTAVGSGITSVSNSGGLVKVGFSAAHGLFENALLTLSGITGVSGLNTQWAVTPVDAKNVLLQSSVWPGGTYPGTGGVGTYGAYSGSIAPYQAAETALVALVKSNWTNYADILWDWDGISALQTPGTTASPGPGFLDACHPIGGARPGAGSIADSFDTSLMQKAVLKHLYAAVMT